MANNSADLNVDIRATENVTATAKAIQSSIIRMVGAVSSILSTLQVIAFPISKAIEFERAMADVRKTTGFTASETRNLSNGLIQMSSRLSISQKALADIAATAGQLGLGRQGSQAIQEFTESVARATVTFGVGEDQVATFAAQLLNIFNLDTSKIENLFSAINELSNNSVASAENLFDVMKRVGNVAGLTAIDVGALAATTADFGVSSEVAGTTLTKFFSNMQSKAGAFAKLMNTTTAEWTSSLEQAPIEAFKRVLTALGQLDTAARADTITKLFGSGRIFSLATKFVNDAANGFEVLNRNLGYSTTGFENGTSSIKEYNTILQTTREQTELLKNDFVTLAIQSGNTLLPLLKEIIVQLREFAQSDAAQDVFQSLVDSVGAAIRSIRSFIEEISKYSIVWQNVLPAIRLFVGFQLAKVIAGITSSLISQVAGLAKLSVGWSQAAAAVQQYVVSSKAAQGIAAARGAVVGNAAEASAATQAAREEAARLRNAAAGVSLARQRVDALKEERNELRANRALQTAQNADLIETAKRRGDGAKEASAALKTQRDQYNQVLSANAKAIKAAEDLRIARAAELAALRGIGAASTAAATGTSRLASVSAGAVKVLSSFSTVSGGVRALTTGIFTLGRGLLAFVGGPLGAAIVGLSLFGDKIFEALGFVTDVDKLAADRAEARATQQAVDQANDLIDVYRETVRNGVNKAVSDFGNLLASQGLTAVNEQVGQALLQFDKLSTAGQGASVAAEVVSREFTDWSIKLRDATEQQKDLNEQIAIAEQRRESLQKIDTADPYGSRAEAVRNLDAQISKLKEASAQVSSSVDLAKTKVSELSDVQNLVLSDASRIGGQMSFIARQLSGIYTEQSAQFTSTLLQLREAQLELNKYITSQTDLKKAVEDAGSDSDRSAAVQALAEVEKGVGEAQRKVALLEAGVRTARGKLTAAEAGAADAQLKLSLSSLREFNKEMAKLPKANRQNLVTQALSDITTSASKLATANSELRKFNDSVRPVEALIQRVKALYDNLTTSSNAAKDKLREFVGEIDRIADSAQKQIAFNTALEKTNKLLSQQENLTIKSLERSRDEAESAGDSGRVAELERQIAKTKEGYEAERTTNKILAEKARLQADINEQLKVAQGLVAATQNLEAPDALRQNLEAKGASQETIVKAVSQRVQELENNAKSVEEAVDRAQKSALEFAKMRETLTAPSRFQTEATSLVPAVSDAEISAVRDKIGGLTTTFTQFQSDTVRTSQTASVALGNMVEETRKSLSDQKDSAQQVLDTYASINPALKNFVTQTTAAYSEFAKGAQMAAEASGKMSAEIQTDIDNITFLATEKLRSGLAGIEANIEVGVDASSLDESVRSSIAQLNAQSAQREALRVNTDLIVNNATIQQQLDNQTFNLKVNVEIQNAKDLGISGSVPGRASGGIIRGPGTGTSDSILARLSDYEYVIKARTVKHYGVGFFDALNNMRLPKFATGGLVGPRPSGGGGGSSPEETININLGVGGRSFPVRSDRQTAKELLRVLQAIEKG